MRDGTLRVSRLHLVQTAWHRAKTLAVRPLRLSVSMRSIPRVSINALTHHARTLPRALVAQDFGRITLDDDSAQARALCHSSGGILSLGTTR